MLHLWPLGRKGSTVVPWCCCSECYCLFCCIRRKRPSQMSWPLLNQKPVLQLTCRTWFRSTSQTSGLWSSRKTSACRVSHWMILTPMFHHSAQICCLSKQLLSEHSRLLLPVLQRSDTHPLLLSETGWAEFSSRPSSCFFFLFFTFKPCFPLSRCCQFAPNGQKSKRITRKRVLWFSWSSAALPSEPSSSSSGWNTGNVGGHLRYIYTCIGLCSALCLRRQLTTFKGAAKTIKLFAKHIKVELDFTGAAPSLCRITHSSFLHLCR